jgi:uncharacterized phage protein (TIGR02218 family)
MKAVVADWQTIVYAMRIVARSGETIRLVQYPRNLVMSGQTYFSDSGYQFTGILSSSSMAASMVDNDGIFTAQGISKVDVQTGKWDGALGYVFATSWQNPVEDEEPIGKFIVGKMSLMDDKYKMELMQLIDALNQPTGRTVTPLCVWTLFDETLDGEQIPNHRSKCRLNIDDYRIDDVVVTAVANRQQFTAAALTQHDDWFGAGSIKFTVGANSVIRSVGVRDFAAGVITLSEPLPFSVNTGDEFSIIPGCRKRNDSDCLGKFDNVINHGGFSRVPPPASYSKVGGS